MEIPVVLECITIDKDLFANFTYKVIIYLLPNGFDRVTTVS